MEAVKKFNDDVEWVKLFDHREEYQMMLDDAKDEGREEGLEKGIKKTALNMLKDGLSIDKKKKYTGLSAKSIKTLL